MIVCRTRSRPAPLLLKNPEITDDMVHPVPGTVLKIPGTPDHCTVITDNQAKLFAVVTRQAMSRDPPQRREARFAKRRCPLHPGGLLPGCRERRPRRDRGGATGTVAASQGFASGMEARQGGDSFAGSVHDSPPHQGDARKSHKQERNGKKRKKRKRKKKKNSNRHGNHRKITSEKNIPDTSQTGRVTGDASAWPASLPAGVSLPGVFARADRRPPPPALYHLFLLPCKM